MGKMYRVKITVLKKDCYKELAEKYLANASTFGPCSCFEVGQETVADGFLSCPPDFCAEAWQNIWPYALAISRGGTFAPYTKEENQWVACCTDGLRPVSFLIERGEEMDF
ncbi:MAG: TIGR04076 family protein [Clostridiales bacterium]|nr:TIGR04076 family protein [Clostridiales bacterium]